MGTSPKTPVQLDLVHRAQKAFSRLLADGNSDAHSEAVGAALSDLEDAADGAVDLREENTLLLMATKNAAETMRALTTATRCYRNAMSIVSSTVANRRKQARAQQSMEQALIDADRMATTLESPASNKQAGV